MKYDTPVYYQMKKHYGQKCMQDIEKLIKHHDFPEEGTLSLTRLKVVRDSVEQSSDKQPGCCCKCVKHVCKKCEQTVDCWLKEADKRERKQMQKELAGRKNEKCESLSVCVSAPPEPTNPQYVCVSPHENAVRPAPPEYKTHIYPMAQLDALKFDPDLDCSPPRQPQQDAQAAQAAEAGRAAQAAQAAQTAQEELEAREDRAARVGVLAAIVEQEVRETARAEQQAEQTAQMALAIQQLVVRAVAQQASSQVDQDEEESKDMRNEKLGATNEKLGAIPKKVVTRSQVKEKVNFTMPMVEVAGPDGSVMVYRPWTVTDMKEAMAHLPSPDDAGDRFSDELTTFCEEFSPTTQELKRLLAVKLGATNWHKVSSQMPTTERRRVHGTWLHEANEQYRSAVTDLTQAMKAAFPARVDTEKINGCCQVREESVRDYYARLFETFRKHSGMAEPKDRGTQPGTWECHLQGCFLNGLRPEIAQAVKASYIEWQSGRLTTTLAHAVHTEEQRLTKKDKAAKGEREMQLAVVQIKASTSAPPAKQNWTNKKKRGYQGKWKCGLCASNEHDFFSCTKCRLCKNDGHWAQDCPEARKAD